MSADLRPQARSAYNKRRKPKTKPPAIEAATTVLQSTQQHRAVGACEHKGDCECIDRAAIMLSNAQAMARDKQTNRAGRQELAGALQAILEAKTHASTPEREGMQSNACMPAVQEESPPQKKHCREQSSQCGVVTWYAWGKEVQTAPATEAEQREHCMKMRRKQQEKNDKRIEQLLKKPKSEQSQAMTRKCWFMVELSYEDSLVETVSVDSDADMQAALTAFVEESNLAFRTLYV